MCTGRSMLELYHDTRVVVELCLGVHSHSSGTSITGIIGSQMASMIMNEYGSIHDHGTGVLDQMILLGDIAFYYWNL